MSNCKKALEEGLNKIDENYKPLIQETALVIDNLNKKGLNPKKFYDPSKDIEIDWEVFLFELNRQRKKAIEEFKNYIENECYEEHEAAIQVSVDKSVAIITGGLSEVLPKHFTHIDVREILKGNILGGKNSLLNKLQDDIFGLAGMGKNNDIRMAITRPDKLAKKVLRKLGIKL
ncbi:hypothetical protein [Aquimarina sp. 2201CG14-23]|uniref:hypothetical protein n=1 Tax=Aquimarina mycalae TaxID=3040073 RepID=UPI0024780073|nr:hypothetical protein [Aquimarina sp. 2201CG14-23]MDH7447243.1 hypothetical protein [Aquimarina sp. 2201CG14-23]